MRDPAGRGIESRRRTAILALLGIAVIVIPCAGVGYLITTFLFAFSGGQYRMVTVVNYVALAAIATTAVVAAVLSRLRSLEAGVKWAAIAAGATWAAALIVEFVLSMWLAPSGPPQHP